MKNWKDIKWIFKDTDDLMVSLRDIYVKNTTISDWENLIKLLNSKYILSFGIDKKQIDIEYIKRMFKDKTGEMPRQSASIYLKGVTVNCHFFIEEEIEFDLCAKEILSELEFNTLMDFMKSISLELGKEIILCDENDAECPIIKIDMINGIETILKKEEAIMQWKDYYQKRSN